MFCTKCGKEIDNKNKFCSYCGAEIMGNSSLKSDDIKKTVLHNQEKSFYIVTWIITVAIAVFSLAFPMIKKIDSWHEESQNLYVHRIVTSVSEIDNLAGLELDGGGVLLGLTVGIVMLVGVVVVFLIILCKNMIEYKVNKIIKWGHLFTTAHLFLLVGVFAWGKIYYKYIETVRDDLDEQLHQGMSWYDWEYLTEKIKHVDIEITVFFWISLVVVLVFKFFILTMYNNYVVKNKK